MTQKTTLNLLPRTLGWRKDVAAGAIAVIVSLPICIASGILALGPLGSSYVAAGASAGLCGAIVGGLVSAMAASSSFVMTSPRVSSSLVLASLIGGLSTTPGVLMDPAGLVASVFLCALLAGLWQCALGLAGFAKIIKFTPHPVLVGFLNGVAILIAVSQLKPHVSPGAGLFGIGIGEPGRLVAMLALAGFMLGFPALARRAPAWLPLAKVPPVLAAFAGGIAGYYLLNWSLRVVDLGPRIGAVQVGFSSPLFALNGSRFWDGIQHSGWQIVSTSLVLAIVATMDTLLALRSAQNAADVRISPVRDLFAHGLGNCAAAALGGVTSAAAPSPTLAAYRAGGRTRLAPISCALIILLLSSLFPAILAGIPAVVLSGILLAIGVSLFDPWTLQLLSNVRREAAAQARLRSLYDLLVVGIVMAVTIFYSIVAGVIAGSLLASIIFIINMSRALVRRTYSGSDIFSKRIRPAKDVAVLQETGHERVVLQLEGVLFFGNADSLSEMVKRLFQKADMIALDMRAISDIDVSGANILAQLVSRSRALNKAILFCGVPAPLLGAVRALLQNSPIAEDLIKSDLDSALEWMEERSLFRHAGKPNPSDVLELREIDFLSGLDALEMETVGGCLVLRQFAAGEVICREGQEGDRMWLLIKGSVSVRLSVAQGEPGRRVASLARGTTVGEMVLLDAAPRSASIVADEPVVCYELTRESFTRLLAEHPAIATKLLGNLARELARRLRQTSAELRSISSTT